MAKERINIVPHPSGGGFSIPFRSGNIDIPDVPGGYAISTGCGSGKTESIKSLIRNYCPFGVLYCVDTIHECTKMRDWIGKELVGGGVLKDDEVLMLTSESSPLEMKPYLDNPTLICQKKVLILTHARFFSDIIDYFLCFPSPPRNIFNGDFKALMTGGGIRRYIVFDETPLMLKPFLTFTKGQLAPYAEYKGGQWKVKSLPEMFKVYDDLIKGDPREDYYKGKNKLCNIKNQVCLQLIHRFFGAVVSDKKHKAHGIHWYPIQLVQKGMSSYVLLYEGAADVLLGSSKTLKLLDIKQKYNANVIFNKFPFKLSHYTTPGEKDYNDTVDEVAGILKGVTGKSLVVVWKDFVPERSVGRGKSEWTKKMTEALIGRGIDKDYFTTTYFGASDTKSTNAYREYNNIVLVGEWRLTKGVTDTLKKAYDCDATLEEYLLWYYTQLLCRIGIRNRDGQDYHVYYSEDYDPAFIKKLELYLNHNIWVKESQTGKPLWELKVTDMCRQQYNERIGKLIGYDPGIKDAIEKSNPYTCTISLSEISSLIPMGGKRQKSNYQSLIEFLAKLGVTLNITSVS